MNNAKAAPAIACETCNIPIALLLAALASLATSQTPEVATVVSEAATFFVNYYLFSCFFMLFFTLSMENLTDENDKGHALVLSDGTPAVFNQAYDLFVIIEW